ncbi:DNA mismatch repair protein MutL [Synechococcus sp. PCC 7502]|uniref:DNA mismatch repair endonuclease MutL n=1 Tax=Synechococcus sp. PCC 7502 TaxID=1173263 RepID=UPI00029F9546|nr:DNA mismatch repair endonuclease MutL [Synechococcus sp. PCC 7502]AFY72562.1 DNA mismatch repair protein MutL [Synechococcus sp. PCC 7502]
MTIIQVLPSEVVNLIAAGEVIDSLGAVVRELVENAIDAQATRIYITVWTESLSIQVRDNGHGMSPGDLEQAATAHTTSKIHTKSDLRQIQSLGFRGEALHSLAQLSDLQICSRVSELEAGWQVSYDSFGNAIASKNIAIALGTIVTARHIFQNHPARLDGLPSISQQLRKLQLLVSEMAIAHPQITWQATLDQKHWFTIWAGANAQDILPQVVKSIRAEDLVHGSAGDTTITMGLPNRTSRHRPDWVRVAINGRFIQIPELEQTIISAFSRTLPRHRYPVCIAHLWVNPSKIDWNRSPAKNEVYLHDLKDWQDQVTNLITKLLKSPEPRVSAAVNQLLRTAESNTNYQANVSHTSQLKVLAQVHNTYILAERSSGLCLIEQHVAHERVLFENLETQWEIIPLASAMIVKNLSDLAVERLRAIGIDIEEFGTVWVVRSLPKILIESFPDIDNQSGDREEVLIELGSQDISQAKATAACRSAIRNGTSLDLPVMQDLVNKWEQTRNPHTCPHGRPICLALESTDLARFFRRNWIVGN